MSIKSHSSPLPRRIWLWVVSLLDEAELAVKPDRCVVLGEDAQGQLVQRACLSPFDRCPDQCGADAATTRLGGNEHRDLTEAEAALDHEDHSDDLARRNGDKRPVQFPSRCTPLDIEGWFGSDSVPFLSDGREQASHRNPVSL